MAELEVFRIIADLVKGLAWPALIGLGVYLFRDHLVQLVPRLRNLPFGATLAPPELQPATPSSSADSGIATGSVGSLLEPGLQTKIENHENDAALQPWRARVEADIVKTGFGDQATVIRVLKIDLAVFRRNAVFERATRIIFGSQIELLARLNIGPLDRDGVSSAYKIHVDRAGENAVGISSWLGFLKSNSFVEGDEGGLTATLVGRDFALFLQREGQTPLNRIF